MFLGFLQVTLFNHANCHVLQVRLDLSQLVDIKDDMDFCCQLAKEEHVIILPGNSLLKMVILVLLYIIFLWILDANISLCRLRSGVQELASYNACN